MRDNVYDVAGTFIDSKGGIGTNVYDISTKQRIVETWLKCSPSSEEEAEKIAEICCSALNTFCALHNIKNVQEYIDKTTKEGTEK